jgi:hypothetical protein
MAKNRVLTIVTTALVGACLIGLVVVGNAGAGGRPLKASLTGAAEAPGPGDPDGSGTARLTLNQGRRQICFTIEVQNITLPATAAHIHFAPVGVPGDIVVPLTPPTGSGCVSASRSLIKNIRKHPSQYYVNVHNSDFPNGAIRGQLGKKHGKK